MFLAYFSSLRKIIIISVCIGKTKHLLVRQYKHLRTSIFTDKNRNMRKTVQQFKSTAININIIAVSIISSRECCKHISFTVTSRYWLWKWKHFWTWPTNQCQLYRFDNYLKYCCKHVIVKYYCLKMWTVVHERSCLTL